MRVMLSSKNYGSDAVNILVQIFISEKVIFSKEIGCASLVRP
jgi:hypothetical protein